MIPHLHLAWPQERLGWSLHGHKAWAPALGTLCPLMRYWTGEGLSVLQPAHLQHLSQTLALGRQSLARRERVHCSCKRGAHVWQGGVLGRECVDCWSASQQVKIGCRPIPFHLTGSFLCCHDWARFLLNTSQPCLAFDNVAAAGWSACNVWDV